MRYMLLLFAAVALLTTGAATASAQYPPDVGSVSATVSDPTPAPGSAVDITAVVLDSAGAPAEGVDVTFTITSSPGGANFDGAQETVEVTDADGLAITTLDTGDEPGTTVVRIEAQGVVTQVTVTTGGPQQLPTTGGTPTGTEGSSWWPLTAAVGIAIAVASAGAVVLRRLRAG